jgi:hypothetical protein
MSKGNVGQERDFGIGWFWFEAQDGPRYVEAIRGAREMRRKAYRGFHSDWAFEYETILGSPASWSVAHVGDVPMTRRILTALSHAAILFAVPWCVAYVSGWLG